MSDCGLPLWRRWTALFAIALAALVCGCTSADDESASGSGGSGGGAGNNGNPVSLAFGAETLTMVPGETRSVTLHATPPGVYRIRFALIGDARDASLDTSEIDTDADGVATVNLTAPTESTTFTLRAAAGDSIAQAGVSVSASGFATLQVKPVYGGKRTVTYWVASVRTGATCAELSGKPLDDGDLKGSAAFDQVPQISDVPVGPALAVTLRGGFSVAGCLDVAEVRAGEINAFSLSVSDLPMNLAETELLLDLGIEQAAPSEWTTAFDGVAQIVTAGLLGSANDDVSALLDAMQDATPTTTEFSAFKSARATEGWDALATVALGGLTAKTKIRAQVLLWMTEGTGALASPTTFRGALYATGKYPGKAVVELATVAGLPAEEAGFRITNNYADKNTWTAQPGDTVVLGARLLWIPSRLLTALAKPPALADVPTASDVADALGAKLSCDDVAAALVAPGDPSQSYNGCDVTCTRALCDTALVDMWQRARDAWLTVPVGNAAVDITATGDAIVDDKARPTGFTGTWLGTLGTGSVTVPLNGPITGYLPPPPS